MTLLTRTGMLAIHSLCMVPLLNILLSQVSWSFRTSYPTCTTISQLLFHYLAGPSNDIQPISLAHKFATLTLFFSGAFIFFFFFHLNIITIFIYVLVWPLTHFNTLSLLLYCLTAHSIIAISFHFNTYYNNNKNTNKSPLVIWFSLLIVELCWGLTFIGGTPQYFEHCHYLFAIFLCISDIDLISTCTSKLTLILYCKLICIDFY